MGASVLLESIDTVKWEVFDIHCVGPSTEALNRSIGQILNPDSG